MLYNFSTQQLKNNKKFQELNAQQRKSCLGMIHSGYGGNESLAKFLEKQEIAKVDWSYHCNCGVCDPEPLIDLVSDKT